MTSNEDKSFQIHLKKEEPWYFWGLKRAFWLFLGWGGLHVALNFTAYQEIAMFRLQETQKVVAQIQQEAEHFELPDDAELFTQIPTKPVSPVFNVAKKADKTVKKQSKKDVDLEDVEKTQKKVFQKLKIYPSDNRLVIPRLGKNVPLLNVPNHTNFDLLEEKMQESLQDGVAVHPVSRPPTQNGNFFITGHSSYYFYDPGRFKDVFALLHEVNQGDKVELYYHGKKYEYVINGQMVVEPDQVEVLSQPNDRKMLTLMTCTPIGTAKERLVLTAEPVKPKNKPRGVKRK